MLDRVVSAVNRFVDKVIEKIDSFLNDEKSEVEPIESEYLKDRYTDIPPTAETIQHRINNSPFKGYLQVRTVEYYWRNGTPYVELDYLRGYLSVSNRIKNYPNSYNDIMLMVLTSRATFYYGS
jgi:hypothetical protein